MLHLARTEHGGADKRRFSVKFWLGGRDFEAGGAEWEVSVPLFQERPIDRRRTTRSLSGSSDQARMR